MDPYELFKLYNGRCEFKNIYMNINYPFLDEMKQYHNSDKFNDMKKNHEKSTEIFKKFNTADIFSNLGFQDLIKYHNKYLKSKNKHKLWKIEIGQFTWILKKKTNPYLYHCF